VRDRADHVAIARDPGEQHGFWTVRHAASPIIAAQAGRRVSMQFIEDSVVPVDRLPDYILALREILARHHLPAVIFGHGGDGNLHVNPLVDVDRPGWRDELETVLGEVAALVASLGGTLSGEHGDGRIRAPLLETIWGSATVNLFREIKEIFDPARILNPGVILPLPGQRPLDSVRPYR
jgi:FAD/FMN-containing dehydrogenase